MKKQENKNRRNFLLCMGGLLVLIVFAFAGPEGLLQLQDKSRLTRSVSISNTGTDYTVWKEEYETDTMRRLQNLADGIAAGKQYYISEQDYEAATDGEIYGLIDEYILNTEWNYTFQDMGVIPEDYFFKNMDTDNISIKRYILYDEKLSDGVAIMAYDICMRMKEEEVTGVSIECVVDSETGTLYAMRLCWKMRQNLSPGMISVQMRLFILSLIICSPICMIIIPGPILKSKERCLMIPMHRSCGIKKLK